MKVKNIEEYIPKSPLELLKDFKETESEKEVLFTFGNEEIVKANGKYYIENTRYPSVNKEITIESATELWQSYNMKSRGDVSINFDFDHNKFNMF